MTPEMMHAERELDARIDHALGKARELREKVDEVEADLAKQPPPTDAEVERFKAFILGHARTEPWQLVIERIERGHLTWRQVVESVSSGRVDPDVRAAMASLRDVPPASQETLVEIGVLPDPQQKAGAAESAAEQPAASDQSGRFHSSHENEEWEDEAPPSWRG